MKKFIISEKYKPQGILRIQLKQLKNSLSNLNLLLYKRNVGWKAFLLRLVSTVQIAFNLFKITVSFVNHVFFLLFALVSLNLYFNR